MGRRIGRRAEAARAAVVVLAEIRPHWTIAQIADHLGLSEAVVRGKFLPETADESDGWTPGHRMAARSAGAKFAEAKDVGSQKSRSTMSTKRDTH